MNAHTPFDANQDWSNPYCQNRSNDPMVDALLGNAYHVVRTVYCNLGNLKNIYDFLTKYGMVSAVESETELRAAPIITKFMRIYDKTPAGDRQVTDYLYVDGDRTGILPDDTTATGSWVKVATSGSSNGSGSTNDGGYIPWIYNSGSAIGGETTIRIPDETAGAPFMVVNGDWQTEGYDFEYDPLTFEIKFTTPLEQGDFVVVMRTGVPATPDNPNVSDWVTINWLYNHGAAVGGEQVIDIPFTFQSVPAVYKNGLRFYKGLANNSYTIDSDNNRIILTEPLATNDRLIVQLGGEANVLEVVDHTIQEVARAANVKDSEVILSTDTTQVLNGKKVIYDVVTQHIYGLPSLPTNVYINTVSNGQLTYSPGNITVDLEPVPGSQDAIESAVGEVQANLDALTASGVATSHRGTLAQDLNAIDRRPDGYGYDIPAILATGPDVQLNEVVSVAGPVLLDSNQRISGVGGNLKQNTSTAAGVRVEGSSASATKDYVTIDNLRSTGSASSMEPGNESYAVFLRNTKYNRISGVLADKYTGGVVAGTSKSLIVRDVIAHDTTFHPLNSSTRDGRGGYGVITDNIIDSIIDGVILDVGAVDDGRHVLYVSTGGYDDTSGNRNFIASNLIGKYLGKDDRNFMGVNVRKSTIFQISNINIDGANSGVAFNTENGDITDFTASNLQLDIIKYADGIGVYGITMPKGMAYVGSRYLISNFNIRVRPKDGSITGADCVGIATSYQNGLVTNGVINVPPAGSPILINDGADNTTISNIHDNILPGYSGETAPMISFTGSAVSNITVRGITTKRPMFARLHVVTDLTVDFDRKARIATNGSGESTKIDANEIISRVALGATSLTVVFPSHVTQNAVENARFAAEGQHQVFINSIGAKQVTLSFFTPSGSLVNPQSTAVTLNVILSS